MGKLNLTTRLSIKVVCIVSLFMLIITIYSQWIALQEKKKAYAEQLAVITSFLYKKMPAGSFLEMAASRGAAGQSRRKQVIAVNRELQPILDNVLIPDKSIKLGFYSRYHESIVAIGPEFDRSLLIGVDAALFAAVYEKNSAQFGEIKSSIVWYGAPALYHIRPVYHNGIIIGQAFACVNLQHIYKEIWHSTIQAFLGGLIALLIVIIVFQEVFIRLKKDLTLFAEEILHGDATHFKSELPELTPIFQYISEQTEKMARLDKLNTIGEMAAGISHEVRNPMTTVRGFLQLLSTKEQLKDQKEYFSLMMDELDRANRIITEFLSLAKNKAMNFQEANLNTIIADISPLMEVDALRHNCCLEVNLGDIPAILLDKNSIRQLILNMVRNGIQAMPQEGGKVTISTAYCGQKVLLSIKDQGTGIPSEVLGKLGTPFLTTKENGTGLGLAICYRIAQRHGATIAVESQPGEGTVFTVGFAGPPAR